MSPRAGFVSRPIRLRLGPQGLNFERAEIRLTGVEQAGPSFEGRVFLNNPNAGLETPKTPENGYAGSFHVYGYGIWPGDLDKDQALRPGPEDAVRAPIEKVVIATEAVRAAASRGPEVTVTVVPVYPGNPPRLAAETLKLNEPSIVIR
jgi:hypothetical protein